MKVLAVGLVLNALAVVGWLVLVPVSPISVTCAIAHALVAGWIVYQILIGDEDL